MSVSATASSVDPLEVEKFSRMAAEWWDPAGKFAPLHKFNPVRLKFIRETALSHFRRDPKSLKPFNELSLLDIGCGGGLLSEPMAKMGFAVTGVDPSEKNIGTAKSHAVQSGIAIDYRTADAESLVSEKQKFDVILNMEVVEHVVDLEGYLSATASLVKPGGIMFVATINKTLKALALAKVAAEYILGWLPPGTHDWDKFIEPNRLRVMLEDSGLNILKTQGIVFDLFAWDWRLSSSTDVNYLIVASA